MLIAQITDLHLTLPGTLAYGVVDTVALTRAAVARLARLDPRPDVVLITGDLTFDGAPGEYAHLVELLGELPMPWLAIPGNHDRRGNMRAGLDPATCPASEVTDRLCWEASGWPVRLLALDTLVEGEPWGEVGAAQLDWLVTRLAEAPGRPTVVLMHHPPVPCGITHMDRIACRDGDRLAAVIARHPQVERVLCGHIHRAIQWRWAGTLLSVAPSVAHQVRLDLRPDSPASFDLEPPAFHLHLWADGAGLATHLAFVERAAGPFPFDDQG